MENGEWRMKPIAVTHSCVTIVPCFSYFRRMMKWCSCILVLVLPFLAAAQTPYLIPHQGIARNGNGEPLANVSLTARFSIHSATPDGLVVWQEQQLLQTNALGLFTAQLGSVVSLSDVVWNVGKRFLHERILLQHRPKFQLVVC